MMSDARLFATIGFYLIVLGLLPLGIAFVVSRLGWKVSGLAVAALFAFTRIGSTLWGMLLLLGYMGGVRRSAQGRRWP
jgi:hypothetical protein